MPNMKFKSWSDFKAHSSYLNIKKNIVKELVFWKSSLIFSDQTELLKTLKGHENGVRCVYLKFPYAMSGSRFVKMFYLIFFNFYLPIFSIPSVLPGTLKLFTINSLQNDYNKFSKKQNFCILTLKFIFLNISSIE